MKKIIILLIFFMLLFGSLMQSSAQSIESSQDSAQLVTGTKISFVQKSSDTFTNNTKIQLFSDNNKNRRKLIGAKVMQSVGAAFFWSSFATYGFLALVAPPSLGVALDATGDAWLPLAGIMASSIIPFIGPFIGAGLCIYMADEFPAFSSYSRNEAFYGGLAALCIILGLLEIPSFVLLVIGSSLKARYKKLASHSLKVGPYIKNNDIYGVAAAYCVKI